MGLVGAKTPDFAPPAAQAAQNQESGFLRAHDAISEHSEKRGAFCPGWLNQVSRTRPVGGREANLSSVG